MLSRDKFATIFYLGIRAWWDGDFCWACCESFREVKHSENIENISENTQGWLKQRQNWKRNLWYTEDLIGKTFILTGIFVTRRVPIRQLNIIIIKASASFFVLQ
jgi:hypothetical protein